MSMTVNKEEVLVATYSISCDQQEGIFRIGDVVKVKTNNSVIPLRNNITGRLRRVDDDEIELDISEKFLSKIIHISFENIDWIEKVD